MKIKAKLKILNSLVIYMQPGKHCQRPYIMVIPITGRNSKPGIAHLYFQELF